MLPVHIDRHLRCRPPPPFHHERRFRNHFPGRGRVQEHIEEVTR